MKAKKILIISIFASVFLFGCSKDYLDIDPNDFATGDQIEDIANSNPDALINVVEPLIQGIYNYLNQYNTANSASIVHNDFGLMSIYHMGDVMNDDLAFHVAGSGWFTYDYALEYRSEQYVRPFFYWNFFYTIIAKANDIISKISETTDNQELKAIRGQALALRAFSHFYVVQMFQQTYKGNENAPGIPVIITPTESAKRYRVPVKEVYEQIINDFKESIALLDGWSRNSKVQINKQVAAGLFSRVHLVMEDWSEAVKYAQMAREGASILSIEEYDADGFNSIECKEWLWGADITSETSTAFASFFSFVCTYDAGYGGESGQYRKIDAKLYNAIPETSIWRNKFKDPNLPVDEKSKNVEIKVPSYTNFKFKKVANWEADYVFMRTSEMILTEAEALARSGNGGQAATVLKELMVNRDPAWNKSTVTGEDVYQLRRVELWGEGFSFFDHLRLKKGIDRNYPGTNHLASKRLIKEAGDWIFLFQIPLREIQNNDLITAADQNP